MSRQVLYSDSEESDGVPAVDSFPTTGSKNGVGRLYIGNRGSLQQVTRELLAVLMHGRGVDIDIINCHPVLLKEKLIEWHGDVLARAAYPNFFQLVDNRDAVLEAGRRPPYYNSAGPRWLIGSRRPTKPQRG